MLQHTCRTCDIVRNKLIKQQTILLLQVFVSFLGNLRFNVLDYSWALNLVEKNTMKKMIAAILMFPILTACQTQSVATLQPKLTEHWIVSAGLASPESAVFDTQRKEIIVSNVNGYVKNQQGYLSKLSLSGKIIQQKWIKGLNGPTGMAIWNDVLYVADIDHLVAINLTTLQIIQRFEAPDLNPGLNDVAVSNNGQVFVTGSVSESVYTLKNNKLVTWVNSKQLKFANGIYAANNKLWVAGYYLRWIDYADKTVHSAGLDNELIDLESIEPNGNNELIITKIGAGPIYTLDSEMKLTEIITRDTFSADVEFIPTENLLVVPSGNNRVFAFKLRTKPGN